MKMADRAPACYVPIMSSALSHLILPIAIGAVALVLLQFIAIAITMLTVWVMGH